MIAGDQVRVSVAVAVPPTEFDTPVTVSVSPFGSVSLASTASVSAVPELVVAESAFAVGATFATTFETLTPTIEDVVTLPATSNRTFAAAGSSAAAAVYRAASSMVVRSIGSSPVPQCVTCPRSKS